MKVIDISRGEAEVSELRQMGMDAPSIRSHLEGRARSLFDEIALMGALRGAPHVVHVEDHALLERDGSVGWTVTFT